MTISTEQHDQLKAAFLAGHRAAKAAKLAGMSQPSAVKLFATWTRTGVLPLDLQCQCGKSISHSGACKGQTPRRKSGAPIVVKGLLAAPPIVDPFESAVWDFRPRLFAYALQRTQNRARAEDFASQALTKALAGRAGFKEETNFSAWMYTIIKNLVNDSYRRGPNSFRYTNISVEAAELHHSGRMSTPEQTTTRLLANEAIVMIAHLPQDQRDICFAILLDGKSYEEVAEHYKTGVGTIKSRLSRAKEVLRRQLGEGGSGDTIGGDP